MKRKHLINLIPFCIAFLLALTTIIQILMKPVTIKAPGVSVRYIVSDPVLYAFWGLIIVLFFVILKMDFWKHAFGLLLIISLTPLMEFYQNTFTFQIGFIQIEMTALILLIFHLSLNGEVIKDAVNFFKSGKTDKKANLESQINYFERKLTDMTKNELQQIVDENHLRSEAVQAAKRLLIKMEHEVTKPRNVQREDDSISLSQ